MWMDLRGLVRRSSRRFERFHLAYPLLPSIGEHSASIGLCCAKIGIAVAFGAWLRTAAHSSSICEAQIQKGSAQPEASKSAPQVVNNP
jgi:hypothetical protein